VTCFSERSFQKICIERGSIQKSAHAREEVSRIRIVSRILEVKMNVCQENVSRGARAKTNAGEEYPVCEWQSHDLNGWSGRQLFFK
jgi:hypothetical protein